MTGCFHVFDRCCAMIRAAPSAEAPAANDMMNWPTTIILTGVLPHRRMLLQADCRYPEFNLGQKPRVV